jgi:hypothetical protein
MSPRYAFQMGVCTEITCQGEGSVEGTGCVASYGLRTSGAVTNDSRWVLYSGSGTMRVLIRLVYSG